MQTCASWFDRIRKASATFLATTPGLALRENFMNKKATGAAVITGRSSGTGLVYVDRLAAKRWCCLFRDPASQPGPKFSSENRVGAS